MPSSKNTNPDASGSGVGHVSGSYRNPQNRASPKTKAVTPQAQGQTSQTTSSPGGLYVWADNPITLGPLGALSFGTRVMKDIGVGLVGVVLLIVGLALLAKPDLSQLARSAGRIVPIPV